MTLRAFWLIMMLMAAGVDYWAFKTNRATLTQTIVWAIPALVGVPLVIIGALHMIGAYWLRWTK